MQNVSEGMPHTLTAAGRHVVAGISTSELQLISDIVRLCSPQLFSGKHSCIRTLECLSRRVTLWTSFFFSNSSISTLKVVYSVHILVPRSWKDPTKHLEFSVITRV